MIKLKAETKPTKTRGVWVRTKILGDQDDIYHECLSLAIALRRDLEPFQLWDTFREAVDAADRMAREEAAHEP